MRTFSDLKPFVDNPHYRRQRERHLAGLDLGRIDGPIVDLVRSFAQLPCCFTLQSCYGHFLHHDQQERYNTEPLPVSDSITTVQYRIAYIALCIEDSVPGRELLCDLGRIPALDPQYIQLGCAEWFWERQVNSYALQVEPRRFMYEDSACVGYAEALHIEETRSRFFAELRRLV
jgi:hypothetical protein